MSKSVSEDISQFTNNPNKLCLFHPIYNVFGELVSKKEALKALELPDRNYILFFGLIREYKELELAIEAMSHPKIKGLRWLEKVLVAILGPSS